MRDKLLGRLMIVFGLVTVTFSIPFALKLTDSVLTWTLMMVALVGALEVLGGLWVASELSN